MEPECRCADERGFSLTELLVTIIILGILAAISIPIFFRQRDKALVAQTQSALANAKLAAAGYYVGTGDGTYNGLDADSDGDGRENIYDEGLNVANGVVLVLTANDQQYCITAVHLVLPATDPWQVATITSSSATPSTSDTC